MNTQEINQLISNSNFDNVLTAIDRYVFVNLDWLTERNYQSQGVNELIFLTSQYTDRIFVFLIRDGVNCRLTGLDYAIKLIINNLKLSSDTCYIYGYDDLEIPNTTFIRLDAVQMWCYNVNQIINLPISKPFCGKKFVGLFGRHDLYRLKFFRHLYDNYKQDSILSYNATRAAWNYRFAETYFDDDKKWYEKNCPVLLDFDQASGWVPFQDSLANISKHYHNYFVEIVCETDTYSNRFFTEKTLKNFHLGKPFLLFSGPGSLEYLKSRGFLTFEPYINEHYDTINCPHTRYLTIIDEIDRLAQLPIFDLQTILHKLAPVFEHNKIRFRNLALGKNL
jgi:hypothetical protein